jgi:hypothetical protein
MTTPPPPVMIGASGTADPASINAQAANLAQRWKALARDTAAFTGWDASLTADQKSAKWAITDPGAASRNDYAVGLMRTLAAIFYGNATQPAAENFDAGLTELAGPPPASPGV